VGGTRAPWPLEACRWSNGGDLRGVKMDGVTWPDPGFWPAIRPEGSALDRLADSAGREPAPISAFSAPGPSTPQTHPDPVVLPSAPSRPAELGS
jgi:hypothetical protein